MSSAIGQADEEEDECKHTAGASKFGCHWTSDLRRRTVEMTGRANGTK
jgi:hypothetical protein